MFGMVDMDLWVALVAVLVIGAVVAVADLTSAAAEVLVAEDPVVPGDHQQGKFSPITFTFSDMRTIFARSTTLA